MSFRQDFNYEGINLLDLAFHEPQFRHPSSSTTSSPQNINQSIALHVKPYNLHNQYLQPSSLQSQQQAQHEQSSEPQTHHDHQQNASQQQPQHQQSRNAGKAKKMKYTISHIAIESINAIDNMVGAVVNSFHDFMPLSMSHKQQHQQSAPSQGNSQTNAVMLLVQLVLIWTVLQQIAMVTDSAIVHTGMSLLNLSQTVSRLVFIAIIAIYVISLG